MRRRVSADVKNSNDLDRACVHPVIDPVPAGADPPIVCANLSAVDADFRMKEKPLQRRFDSVEIIVRLSNAPFFSGVEPNLDQIPLGGGRLAYIRRHVSRVPGPCF